MAARKAEAYHRLYSTDPDYSAGLTRYEHQEYHRMLRAGEGGGTKTVDRLRARQELLRDIKATLPDRTFRARASAVALLEQDEMRRAAGALGRSSAYDEMLASMLPTEPSGADREDEPKAPPQTRDEQPSRSHDESPGEDITYPSADRGAGIGEGEAEGRPESIWDDNRKEEDD